MIELPAKMRRLPVDKHGRPVPWFVAWIDGQPDFRVIRPGGIEEAWRFDRCWVCGERRGRNAAFVIGPMCAVNHVSAEPPSHIECARYAAQACPFLATPAMVRRERGLPEDAVNPAGEMIRRNPGVALVWLSRTFKSWDAGGGTLFDIGQPVAAEWYAHGRPATRDEVMASIESGIPLLRQMIESETTAHRRTKAALALDQQYRAALELVPT